MANKITIIGGSGFVGTNLCNKLTSLQQNFEIIDLKASKQFPEKFKFGDVRDVESLRKTISGDVVINLAAVHRDDVKDKSQYKRTNVDGAENIALVCCELGVKKIIFTSSVAVYGFANSSINEDGKINPFNEYGYTKFAAEEKFRKWQKKTQNSLIIVRPTVIFGEGNRGNVFNLLNQIASGRFVMIGRGDNRKSMAYIGNVVAFLEACINSEQRYGLFNYVDTPDFSMNELVEKVRLTLLNKKGVGFRLPYWLGILFGHLADALAKVSGRNFAISSIRVKKFNSSTQFASNKINLDEFTPPFTINEGLERTLSAEFIFPDPSREVFFTE